MNWYSLGRQAALEKLGIANTHPLMKGTKVDVEVPSEKPEKAPVARVWPPPPHATSGTLLNAKVAVVRR